MMELRDQILSGIWKQGERLPGEFELARQRGVSVITTRQALSHLSEQGLINRERAKGTFVAWSGPLKQAVQLEIETEEITPVDPKGTTFNLLGVRNITPSAEYQRDFKLGANDKMTQIDRIRMIHGYPLAYVVSYAPLRIAHQIPSQRMRAVPLSTAIEQSLKIKLSNVKHVVSAKLSDDEVSAHLEVPHGSPILFVERDHFYKKELIMRTAAYYRSDLFRYELKLKRKKAVMGLTGE